MHAVPKYNLICIVNVFYLFVYCKYNCRRRIHVLFKIIKE